jgi:S-(hydroxymethyl)glutathione dehydrogenase/alcohol dehydrogenase
MDGDRGPTPPVVLGHEGAGVVTELGSDVTAVAVGDAVVISTLTPCNACRACAEGRYTDCSRAFGTGNTPFAWNGEPVRAYANCSSFAGEITVQARQLVPADGLDPLSAALIGCAVSTGYGVVRNVANVRAGQAVAVFGIGGIGVNVVQTARLQGASPIIAVDVNGERAATATRFGADAFVTVPRAAGGAELAELVRAAAGGGAIDVSIECSGAPAAIDGAIRAVGVGGTVALVGIPPAGTAASFDVYALLRGQRIVGSLNGATDPTRDMPAIVEHVRAGELDIASQVSRVWPVAEVADAVAAVRRGEVVRAVLDHTR